MQIVYTIDETKSKDYSLLKTGRIPGFRNNFMQTVLKPTKILLISLKVLCLVALCYTLYDPSKTEVGIKIILLYNKQKKSKRQSLSKKYTAPHYISLIFEQ